MMPILNHLKITFKIRKYWVAIANTLTITGFRPFSNDPNLEHSLLIYGGIIMLLAAFIIPIKPEKTTNI